MKRNCLVIILFLIAALSFNGTVWATVECCCEPIGCHFPPSPSRGPFAPPKDFTIDDCYYWEDDGEWKCNEQLICISELTGMDEWWWVNYNILALEIDGSCEMHFTDDDCESESLLGNEHPGLDILRQFRDKVLARSEKGRRLTEAYYKYGDLLIKAFEANPALEVFATEILEKTIERLLTASGSDEELLTDDIAAGIEILADELDMVVVNPGLKKTLRQVKGDMKRGKLF